MVMYSGGTNRPLYQVEGKGNCPYCHKPVKRGGIKHWDCWYHRQCLRMQERSDLPKWKARRTEV